MNSRIIKLADIDRYVAADELRDFSVPEEVVAERLESLAENCGEEVSAETVAGDCCVRLVNAEGQTVLVFPSLPIPGAEEISAMLVGKKIGDTVSGLLAGAPVTLTVTEILIRVPAEKDDTLAARAGIEGVDSLAQLLSHIRETEEQKKRNAAEKAVTGELMAYLEQESEAEIDEAEAETWAQAHAATAYQENLAAGIDLRFTPEGDMLSEEEVLAMLVEDMKSQFRTKLVIDCCCETWGHEPDPAEYMAMLPPDMEEGEPGDELIEQLKENDCYMFVMDRLAGRAKEVLA